MSKYRQAVILAGGKGRRLQPYTTHIPKPLMPVGDMPILEIVLRQLHRYRFRRIKIAVGHLSGLIKAYFGNGKRFGLELEYSQEDNPLGTVGPLRLIDDLDNNFLILNGDLITDMNFGNIFETHNKKRNLATIGVYKKKYKIDLGILDFDPCTDKVKAYIEKPNMHYSVSMGIYVLSRKIVSLIPKGKRYDFPDLINALINEKHGVGCYHFQGYWRDIGNHEDYNKVNREFNSIRHKLLEKS